MSGCIYSLNSGDKRAEANRLEFQHHAVFTPITGGLIPDELRQHLISLGRPPVVADIATGTGIWLQELAAELPPDTQLDGYDFDTSKYPEQSQLPPNVRLMWGDALKPIPNEACGIYDLVHVQYLMYGLKAHQWEDVARNLRSMLQPGGYLFWAEIGYPGLTCLPMTESFQKLLNLHVRYSASVGRDITAPVCLHNQIKHVGYINCFQTTFSSFSQGKEVQKLAGQVLLAGIWQSIRGIIENGGFDWVQKHEDADGVINTLYGEIEQGVCYIGLEIYWVVGQCPLIERDAMDN